MQTRRRLPRSTDTRLFGRGLASASKNVGYSFGFDDHATAAVTVTRDGATVRIGAAEVGQGVATVLTQIAADSLALAPRQCPRHLVGHGVGSRGRQHVGVAPDLRLRERRTPRLRARSTCGRARGRTRAAREGRSLPALARFTRRALSRSVTVVSGSTRTRTPGAPASQTSASTPPPVGSSCCV